ncbi:MAG: DMT family transporter [Clostridia bacterium]|nr:DMT family transporter [Clostridia bacterium]
MIGSSKLKGNLLLLLTAFIWGTSFIAQSVGVETVSPTAFIGIRCLLGSGVLLPVIFFLDNRRKEKGEPVQKMDKNLLLGGILCGIVLYFASVLQTAGMVYTSPGKSGFITALYMVFIPIVRLFAGKRPSVAVWAAVAVAVCGMYLLCIDTDFSINYGDVLTLICAFFFTAHILVIDKFSPMVDGVKLSCLQFFVCGLIGIVAMFFDTPAFRMDAVIACWKPICYSGILSCGVAYTLQVVAQKYTDPTSASILMSLESVFSTLSTVVLVALGWELTGGALSGREIAGCVLMFVAILLVQLPDLKKKI